MEAAPMTGIEIEVGYSKLVTKALHLFHLDGFVKGQFDSRILVITLDGREQRVPMHDSYFVDAAPGQHQLTVSVGDFLGKMSVAEPALRASLEVPVQANHVTTVRYEVGVGGSVSFNITGTRTGTG